MHRFTLEGKIIVFKTFASSIFCGLLTQIMNQALCRDFKHDDLKNVNIQKKIMRRQCSWGKNCMTILSMNGNQYR